MDPGVQGSNPGHGTSHALPANLFNDFCFVIYKAGLFSRFRMKGEQVLVGLIQRPREARLGESPSQNDCNC